MTDLNRRNFLRQSLIATAGGVALLHGTNVFAKTGQKLTHDVQMLKFYNTHTGERRHIVYREHGSLIEEGLQEINFITRDFRTGDIVEMDPKLMDLLHGLQSLTNPKGEFEIISGYRSPKSNQKLRNRDSSGVAKRSFHMQGRAIDIRLQNVDLKHLYRAARELKVGGVGYYPGSNFIHVDTGRVRTWKG